MSSILPSTFSDFGAKPAVLRNPACVSFTFNPFDGFDEIEDPLFGEIRQEYRGNESNFHFVYRIKNEFYCQS